MASLVIVARQTTSTRRHLCSPGPCLLAFLSSQIVVSRTASAVTTPMPPRSGEARQTSPNPPLPPTAREMHSPLPPPPRPPRLAHPLHHKATLTNRPYRASRHTPTTLPTHSRRIIMARLGTQVLLLPPMSTYLTLVSLQARSTRSKVHPHINHMGTQVTIIIRLPPTTLSDRV